MTKYILSLLFGLLLGYLANAQPFKTVVEKAVAFSEQQRLSMAQKYEDQVGVLQRLKIIAHHFISDLPL